MFRVTTVIATECSLLQESYCSNSKNKKKIRVREAVGGFFVCLLSKISFREPIGDALMSCINEHRKMFVNCSQLYFFCFMSYFCSF